MRVGTLPEGTRFVTRLTKRAGRVLDQFRDSAIYHANTQVRFEDGELKFLHPDVQVDEAEEVH